MGAGFFYPSLVAYQQRSRISALMMADEFLSAERELQQLERMQGPSGRTSYLRAVLARRTERSDDFQYWLNNSKEQGFSEALLDLQSRFFEVQRGKIDTAGEVALSEQADSFSSDEIALQTYEAVARGYLTTYRLKEAWQCIEYWLEWQPNTVSARFMRAEIAQRTGMPELAVQEFRKILETAPDQAAAKEKLADSLLKLNEVDEAAKLLKEVCSISDDQPQPQIILAEAERRLGNMDAARAAIERAMELGVDPQQRAQCNTILGQLSLANQQPSAAVEYLMTAVELTPQDAVAQLALGRALTLAGNQELGQVHIERAQQIRDSYEQIQTWTRAVIENPQDPDLRTKIGQAMIDQGMRSEGVRWVQTALECDSGFAPAKEILDRMATFNGPTP